MRHTSFLPGNPEDTTDGLHLAQGSVAGITRCCNSLLSTNPPHRLIWNWNNGEPARYPTIYKGHYFPADRQPDTRYTPAAKPLSWFQANHPDWIEYRCDRTRVAYEFGTTTYIPLDITNHAVLTWEEQHFWGSTAASGTYQMLAFDNFQMTNGGSWSGQRCGHYAAITAVISNPSRTTLKVATANGIRAGTWIAVSSVRTAGKEDIVQVRSVSGTTLAVPALAHAYADGDWVGRWTQQYQARGDDPAYRRDEIALAANIRSWLRTFAPGIAFSANISWNPSYPADSNRLVSKTDVWWDQDGFNRDGQAPYVITDSGWRAKAAGLSAFLASGRHGWVDGAATEHDSRSWTPAEVNWFLGNYLLFKNDTSWLFPHGPNEGDTVATWPLFATANEIGVPTDTYYEVDGVYWRDFTHGLVLVNPSSRISRTILLGALHYRDLWGVVHQGAIALGPAKAVVLFSPLF
jgi:hypothetical protein